MLHALSSVARLSVGMTLTASLNLIGRRHGSDSCLASLTRRHDNDSSDVTEGDRVTNERRSTTSGRSSVTSSRSHHPGGSVTSSRRQSRTASSPEEFRAHGWTRVSVASSLSKDCHGRHLSKGRVSFTGGSITGAYYRAMSRLNPLMSRSMEDLTVSSQFDCCEGEEGMDAWGEERTRLTISQLTGIHTDFLRPLRSAREGVMEGVRVYVEDVV